MERVNVIKKTTNGIGLLLLLSVLLLSANDVRSSPRSSVCANIIISAFLN